MSRHNKIAAKDRSLLASFKEEIAKLVDEDLVSRSAQVARDLYEKKINRKYAVAQLSSIASEVNRRAHPVKQFDKIKIRALPMPVQEQAAPQEEVVAPAL